MREQISDGAQRPRGWRYAVYLGATAGILFAGALWLARRRDWAYAYALAAPAYLQGLLHDYAGVPAWSRLPITLAYFGILGSAVAALWRTRLSRALVVPGLAAILVVHIALAVFGTRHMLSELFEEIRVHGLWPKVEKAREAIPPPFPTPTPGLPTPKRG